MRLTPLDIRKQEFGRGFRGFAEDEVTSFLQMLSNQWEEMLTEQRGLEQKVRDAEVKLEHYLKIEEALQEALRTARESAKQALENAQHQANQLLREAERRSDEIKRSAEQERLALRREAAEMRTRRNEIAARLRAFLNSELELLARFESDFPGAAGMAEPLPGRSGSHGESDGGPRQEWSGVDEMEAENDTREAVSETDHPREEGRPSGWVVRPVISAPATPREEPGAAPEPDDVGEAQAGEEPDSVPEEEPDTYGISASADEIERIKRILKDLE